MRSHRPIALALAIACTAAACSSTQEETVSDDSSSPLISGAHGTLPNLDGTQQDSDEQRFLSALTARGVSVESSEEATVIEVGHGICRSLASGSSPDEFGGLLRPVTEPIAARSADFDADGVADVFVEVSRDALCE